MTYINQYKLLFLFSWIALYLIFPMWALPISIKARAFVFFGLMTYFFISAHMMSRWFNALNINTAIPVKTTDWLKHVKSHLLLVIVCCIALILHIRPLFLPILIIGDEPLHLGSGLLIYSYIDNSWHAFIQIAFWLIVGSLIFIKKNNKIGNFISNKFSYLSGAGNNNLSRFVFVFSIFILLVSYFLLLRNITYSPSMTRYPPLIKILYYNVYLALGITHVGPRMLQLAFYVLGAVYLYRTILIFSNKESALIGATIYLFLPVMFAYAKLAEPDCVTVFLVILVSFHFLRFINQGDDRDLILTSFFIGTGFMYKRIIFLMFFICSIYLIAKMIKNRDWHFINYIKIMLLSLVSIMPLMVMGRIFTWRNYDIHWSNARPFDGKAFTFFLNFPRDISWIFFTLFLFAILYNLRNKRNELSLYFGLLFIAFYLFLVFDLGNYSPRLYMALYPAITVYLSQFLQSIIDKVRWKHSFRISYLILSIYLISICTIPSIHAQFIADNEFIKLKYFPTEAAMKWVKGKVDDGDRILILRILSSEFYLDKYKINKNKVDIYWYKNREVSTPKNLMAYYKENKISFIMFPSLSADIEVVEYLKKNQYKEFIEVARFNRDDNYIYVYRLKDS